MSIFLRIYQRLFTDLGLSPPKPRAYQLNEELVPVLKDLAKREHRSEGEVLSGLLSDTLAQRQRAEKNLQRWEDLSLREQEVVALVCIGYTNQEVADRLVISPETVKAHLRSAALKFGLHTKSQLQRALDGFDFSTWDTATHTD